MDYPTILRAAGLTVVEIDGWQTRGRPGSFTPQGFVLHHTAAAKGGASGKDVNTIINGRADLPGPLANLFLGREGWWYVVAAGKANHAGAGSRLVYDELLRDIAPSGTAYERGLPDDWSDGNAHYLGLEIDNDGVGEPYPPEQIGALDVGVRAIIAAHNWSPNRVIAHKEHSRRKPDPSFDMKAARSRFAAAEEGDELTPEEHEMLRKVGVTLGALDNNARARHADVLKRLDALEAKVGTGGGATPAAIADELAHRLES